MESFKQRVSIVSILVILVSPVNLLAQRETNYHYACAIDNEKKILYISSLADVIFYESYDYKSDEYFSAEMQRQFLRYIDNNYGEGLFESSEFIAFKMSENKALIKTEIKKQSKKYKALGYKVVKVKGFCYD